jgi:hypothetical protein
MGRTALLASYAYHSAGFGFRASEHMSPKGAAHSIGTTSQTFKPSKMGMGSPVSNFVLSGHSWQSVTMKQFTTPRSGMTAARFSSGGGCILLYWQSETLQATFMVEFLSPASARFCSGVKAGSLGNSNHACLDL